MRISLFLFCLILLAVPVQATTLPFIKGNDLLAVRHDSDTKTIWTATKAKQQTIITHYDQTGKRIQSWTGPLSSNVHLLKSYVILYNAKQILVYNEQGMKQFTLKRPKTVSQFDVTNDGTLQLSDDTFRYTFTPEGNVKAKQLLSFHCTTARMTGQVKLSCLQPKRWTTTIPLTGNFAPMADVTVEQWLEANVIALHIDGANGKSVRTLLFNATGNLLRQFTSQSHVTLGSYIVMSTNQYVQAYHIQTGAILSLAVKKPIIRLSGYDQLLTVTTPATSLRYLLANDRFTLLYSGDLMDVVPLRNGSFVLVTPKEAIFFDKNGRKWTTIPQNFSTHQSSFTTENGVMLVSKTGHFHFFHNDGTLVYDRKWTTLPTANATHLLTIHGQKLELTHIETGKRSVTTTIPGKGYELGEYQFNEQQQFGLLVYTNAKTKAFLIQILTNN